jgi:two-component system capsular synthesis sensor histidine kinase RcsC
MNVHFLQGPNRSLSTLVVDDNHEWRRLVAENVELHVGSRPYLAANGQEALEIMAERPIDLVLSDLFMPEMDGFKFLQEAQKLYPRTKVILLSADFGAFPISAQQLIERGALAAISKAEIGSTLARVLRVMQEDFHRKVMEINASLRPPSNA